MQQIPLSQVPSQEFTILLDNNTWDIKVKQTVNVMAVSLNLNGNDVIDNLLAVSGSLIIPAEYEEDGSGNFFFVTQSNALPDYAQFGVTQILVYVSAAELATFRTAPSAPITSTDFNPIAAVPLRFAPEGYVQA